MNILIDVFPDWTGCGIVLAVSGGADSTAMLRCFAETQGRVAVVHVNHGMRGKESDDDADFVAELASRLGLECHQCRLTTDDFAGVGSGSWEADARELRYRFLCRIAEQLGFRYAATAHTRDDQVETVLLRILRGTGIAGLAGIPRHRSLSRAVTLVRPMLDVSREEILDYLREKNQPFRHDSSNNSPEFMRNKIRSELLPLLRSSYHPGVENALLRLARQSDEWSDHFSQETEQLFDRHVKITGPESLVVEIGELTAVSRCLIRELFVLIWKKMDWHLREMGFEQWEKLAGLLFEMSDSNHEFPGNIRAERRSSTTTLWLHRKTSP